MTHLPSTLWCKAVARLATLCLAGLLALPAGAQDRTAAPPPDEMMIPASRIPFVHDWMASPHAKADARAFNNWNADGEIPKPCARCHATPGFLDYIGADGSAAGVVDRPAPTGSVIGCTACHNETTRKMTGVTFPSGLRVEGLGAEARCMTCHQGRESGASVDRAVAGLDEDAVDAGLEFVNVHYRQAGATLMGMLAGGGYQYPGRTYASQRRHAAPLDRCTTCHELHTVAPRSDACAACHQGVTDRDSLRLIRKSPVDFDGNGDVTEGIAAEIDAMRAKLLLAMQAYAREAAAPIGYAARHPYFFHDANDDGSIGEDEAQMPNRFTAWTPRLLKAAYNYQFVTEDPGAYAHNAPYVLQLMHDSLADLSMANIEGLTRP